ncbi:MAG: DMT family transporter [Bacteroidetes bacterium]|nr:MAG: DMT family transporter [Bacteroidota bacterium]
MQKNVILVYFLTLLAITFWGISYVWMKVVYEYYEPITTMFLRLSLSSVFLFIILGIFGKKEKVKKEDYKSFVILSFFSPFCYFIGESFGLKYVTPTIAAVIIATIPVFTPMLGYFVFRERITRLNLIGFFISFSGVIIMVLDFEFRFSASPLGVGLLFFAVISALVNIVYLKKLAIKYSSTTIIKVQNLLGALFFLPFFLIFDFSTFITVQPTAELAWALLKLAVFASTLAFVFFTIAVRVIGVARTSVFANLIPVFTAIFSFFLLQESIDLSKILGIIIVISGIFLSQSASFRRSKKV